MELIGTLKSDSTGHRKMLIIALNLFFFVAILIFFITTVWYFAFEAEELLEYAVSAYYVVTSSTFFMVYLEMFRVRNYNYDLFRSLDLIVEKSKKLQLIIMLIINTLIIFISQDAKLMQRIKFIMRKNIE